MPKAMEVVTKAKQLAVNNFALFSGAAVERCERLDFQRPNAVTMNLRDARAAGLAPGERVVVTHAGGTTRGRLRLSRTLAEGAVRFGWSGNPVSGPCTVEREA